MTFWEIFLGDIRRSRGGLAPRIYAGLQIDERALQARGIGIGFLVPPGFHPGLAEAALQAAEASFPRVLTWADGTGPSDRNALFPRVSPWAGGSSPSGCGGIVSQGFDLG
jgi:hypothetical protein